LESQSPRRFVIVFWRQNCSSSSVPPETVCIPINFYKPFLLVKPEILKTNQFDFFGGARHCQFRDKF
jgi:hypothetical protein